MAQSKKCVSKPNKKKQAGAFCNTNITKARGYCFTLNNYTAEDIDNLVKLEIEYGFQEETGESGTPHLQGYLYYPNAVSFETVKKLLPRAHIEKMQNLAKSRNYCRKEETRTGAVYSNMPEIGTVGTVAQLKNNLEESKNYKKNFWKDMNKIYYEYSIGKIPWEMLTEEAKAFVLEEQKLDKEYPIDSHAY